VATPEPALLPGGGVQVPQGFHISQTDQGHYRAQSADRMAGEPDPARMFGRFFKGLKNIPAVLVRAGRTRTGEDRYLEPDAPMENEDEGLQPGPSGPRIPPRSDVETYVSEAPPEDDGTVIQEGRLQDYNRQRLMRRDRAFDTGSEASRRNPNRLFVPPPQPVPVPGSHTPAPSQAGVSEAIPPSVLDARLEAEQMRRENEALRQAQELERTRHRYAADLVRSPPSTASRSLSRSRFTAPESMGGRHRRAGSEPVSRFPHRVFSRWADERDPEGNRVENPPDETELRTVSSHNALIRFFRFIRDMPWVGDRIAADIVPGGVKPHTQATYYNPNAYHHAYGYERDLRVERRPMSPGSDSAFSDPYVPSEFRYRDPNVPRIKPGQSWYATEDYDIVTLPPGVPPPPGFEPISFIPPNARPSAPPPDVDPTYSSSEHTHVESHLTSPPAGSHVSESEQYTHFMPAGASQTGESYTFVPGRSRQPLVVPSEFSGVPPLGSIVSGAR